MGQNSFLKWHINTGAIPIFTSTKPQRISLYAHLDDFDLEESELFVISSLNDNYKLYLESLVCPWILRNKGKIIMTLLWSMLVLFAFTPLWLSLPY